MQHDNYDMDKKLRQLENQSLPDLSKMDEHWRQLKNTLQPGNIPTQPARGLFKNATQWLIAAGVTGLVCLAIYQWLLPTTHTKNTAGLPAPGLTPSLSVTGDTTYPSSNTTNSSTQTNVPAHLVSPVKIKLPASPAPLYTKPVQGKETPLPVVLPPDDQQASAAEEKALLADFFGQLEKPAQEFVINSQRDTMLMGQNGTALLIAAHTFAGKNPITIIIKEFYSYEDIITNRLATLSKGSQLITGGMIHISAMADGREIDLPKDRTIRWFVPDTTAGISQMQLFTGQVNATGNAGNNMDTLSQSGTIDWIPQNQLFARNFLTTSVKVLDIRDSPFKVVSGKKLTGKFYLDRTSLLNKEEVKALLAAKYPKYDKIVVRRSRVKKNGHIAFYRLFGKKKDHNYYVSVGDSARISLDEARMYQLPATDTMTYRTGNRLFQNNFLRNEQLRKIAARYSVDITTLGWINCDRFYNDNRPKISFVVNLPDTASGYSTFLVFDKIKSMMTGATYGNQVRFTNVPAGETVRVISVGIQDKKTVAAMQDAVLSGNPLSGLRFEETTPAEFREQAAAMDR